MPTRQVKEAGSTSRHYETLDDLLSAISPPYLQRRQRLLFAKLEDVAKDRSWSDQEQPQHDERAEKADSSHST